MAEAEGWDAGPVLLHGNQVQGFGGFLKFRVLGGLEG